MARPLTPRETEIVKAIAAFDTTAGAARQLSVAPGTVQKSLHVIYIKVGVRSRAGLVRWAYESGLVRARVKRSA